MTNTKSQAARDLLSKISLKAKQVAFNLSEVAVKAKDATNNETWGPHGQLMSEISEGCYDADKFKQVWEVLNKRIVEGTGCKWRMTYKTLLVIEFLLKQSSQHVVQVILDNLSTIQDLQKFSYKDEAGKDWGLNVRNRAKELCLLLENPDRIRGERAKAKANKEKYKGMSSVLPASGNSPSITTSLSRNSPGFQSDRGALHPPSNAGALQRAVQEDGVVSGEEDAFMATARRINSMKESGLLTSGTIAAAAREPAAGEKLGDDVEAFLAESPVHTAAKPTLRSLSDTKMAAPKKLGDVRVNPSIAAAFLGLKLAPPPGSPKPPVEQASPTPPSMPAAPAMRPPVTDFDKDHAAVSEVGSKGISKPLDAVAVPPASPSHATVAPVTVDPFALLSEERSSPPLPERPVGSPTAKASGNPFGPTITLNATPAALPEYMFTPSPLTGLVGGYAAGPTRQEGASKPVGLASSRSPLLKSPTPSATVTPPRTTPLRPSTPSDEISP